MKVETLQIYNIQRINGSELLLNFRLSFFLTSKHQLPQTTDVPRVEEDVDPFEMRSSDNPQQTQFKNKFEEQDKAIYFVLTNYNANEQVM